MRLARREILAAAAATAGAVAGCSSSDGTTPTTPDGPTVAVPESAATYLSNADGFAGVAVDETDSDVVPVAVGAPGNGGDNAFDPVAVAVSPGTTVRWEWTGRGLPHNVVAEDGSFDSGPTVIGDDETFEHTVETPGTFRYFCTPHKAMGMKGVIVVE